MSGTDIFEQLNDALFAQMDKLQGVDAANSSKLEKAIAQSEAVADLAEKIIHNNNSKIRALQFFDGLSRNVDSAIAQRDKMLGDGRHGS